MKRSFPSLLVQALILGALIALGGVVFSKIPYVSALEQDMELDWLFKLRGSRTAPSNVVVVSIDQASSRKFGLPNQPRKWPRSYHAKLIDRLVNLGARVIVFDIMFDEYRDPEEDRAFAQAIERAGNVILFQYLRRENIPAMDSGIFRIDMERLISPIPEFATAAVALAPFPLPKVPAKVCDAWTFKASAGDAPTMPSVALQHYLLQYRADLDRLLLEVLSADALSDWLYDGTEASQTDAFRIARRLRVLFRNHPDLTAKLMARLETWRHPKREALASLIDLYSGNNRRFLDFYGPPLSISTVPYHKLVEEEDGTLPDLAGKAVFVGFSEQFQPEQKDGFYTVFSQPDGLDISGVEIAATAFANLYERREIKPLDPTAYYGFIVGWGLIAGVLLIILPGAGSVLAAALMAALGASLAYYWFTSGGTWLPLLIPIVVQLPVALTGALLWRYLYTQRERRKLRSAFGYFLPGPVVDELIQDTAEIADKGQLVNGICLATDAEQYTRLSEDMDPQQLRDLLNRYFKNVFEPVRYRGGFVSDVVGDAMLAIWATTGPDLELRRNACLAALEIIAATEQFNRLGPETPLPTRIGLHRGEMALGSVGAGEHYEYRAVGDIVNAASRIENLNKQLGTRLLASADVIEGVDGILTREMGRFRLVGKRRPLVIHELICSQQHVTSWIKELHGKFAEALNLFKAQRWHDALWRFYVIKDQFDYGPARFYVNMCEQCLNEPSTVIDNGTINLSRK